MKILGIDLGTDSIRISPPDPKTPADIEEIPAKLAITPNDALYESHFLEKITEKKKIKSVKQTAFQALKQCLSSSNQVKGSAAVIAIPAFFDDAQRLLVKSLAEEVGIKVLRLLPQPTAAAIAHYLNLGESQNLLVLDLGAGSFECSLLTVNHSHFEVIKSQGSAQLSGRDLDECFCQFLNEKRKATNQTTLNAHQNQQLRNQAQAAKIKLGTRRSIDLQLQLDSDIHVNIGRFTREDYRHVIEPILNEMTRNVITMLRAAGKNPEDIDRVLLVGAAAKSRLFLDYFHERFRKIEVPNEPQHTVVKGAAMVAAQLADQQALAIGGQKLDPRLAALKFQDVIPHSLGIAMKSEKGWFFKKSRFIPILEKDNPYPAKAAVLGFSDTLWNERIEMKVFRGECDDPKENTNIGKMSFSVSKKYVGSVEVAIACIFELDADGLLTFTAIEMPSHKKAKKELSALIKSAQANDLKVAIEDIEDLKTRHGFKARNITLKTE